MIVFIRAGNEQKSTLPVPGTRGGDVHPPAVAFWAFVENDFVVAIIEYDPVLKVVFC